MLGYLDKHPPLTTIKNVVVVHYPCHDGFTAAWVAWQNLPCDKTLFFPANYGKEKLTSEQIAERFGGRDVYILDFSYSIDVLLEIADVATSVVLCDHHKTFYENLIEAVRYEPIHITCGDTGQRALHAEHFAQMGMDFRLRLRSDRNGVTNKCVQIYFHHQACGAEVAYRYFQSLAGKAWDSDAVQIPRLIQYVGDRDLWTWQLPYSAEFSAALGMQPHTFNIWDAISRDLEQDTSDLVDVGKTILAYERMRVEQLCRNAYWKEFNLDGQTYRVPVVNSQLLISEVGHQLCNMYPDAPFAGVYFENRPGEAKWSLRGRDSDDFDVSAVAKSFGGGGHKKAAGFILPRL